MASIVCGWCKERCHMTLSGQPIVTRDQYYDRRYIADAAFICDGCGRMSVATWVSRDDPTDRGYGGDAGPGSLDEAKWSPPRSHQKTFPDVPNEISDLATEAWTCHTVGALHGAVALARAVVEGTAREKGITGGNLMSKIGALAAQGLIRPAVEDQAHEIRHIGNDVAHWDLEGRLTQEESEEVLELMTEVLREVFQAPARQQRLAARRLGAGGKPTEL
jgi:hypothetical protein